MKRMTRTKNPREIRLISVISGRLEVLEKFHLHPRTVDFHREETNLTKREEKTRGTDPVQGA